MSNTVYPLFDSSNIVLVRSLQESSFNLFISDFDSYSFIESKSPNVSSTKKPYDSAFLVPPSTPNKGVKSPNEFIISEVGISPLHQRKALNFSLPFSNYFPIFNQINIL